MGSHSYLSRFDGRLLSPPDLEAKYYVPIFWLALFEPGDLHNEPIAGAQWTTRPEVFSIQAPYLLAPAAQANARFARRSPALARLCTPAHAALVAKFAGFVQTLKPSILVRLDGLAGMTPPGAFAEQVRGALALMAQLDDRDADRARYLVPPLTDVWSANDWEKSRFAEGLLSGWNWQ
jgi:hypothetical protein